ncbi:MAG: DnaA N-terminal domain-containing protein, partial [Hyphococcus sp.]
MNNKDAEGGSHADMFNRYLEALRGRVGEAKYKSWFFDLGLAEMTDDCVTLSTGSKAKRDMLDNRYLPMLADTWRQEIGPIEKMRLTVQQKLRAHASKIDALEEERALKSGAVKNGAANGFVNGGVDAPLRSGGDPGAREARDFSAIATPLDKRRTFEAF